MDLAAPLRTVTPSLDAEALAVLAGTTAPLTGNRVAALAARGSRAGLMKVLARLVTQGVVLAEPAGSATLYRLNRDHLLCEPLLAALGARRELLARLTAHLEAWPVPCLHAAVFGSLARGEGGPASDIDVLVVRSPDTDADDPGWQHQLRSLELAVRAWTGNRLSWFEALPADLARAAAAGDGLLEALRADAIVLTGVPLQQLLDRAA